MKSTTLLPLCVWEFVCGLNFLLLHVIQYVAFVFSITLCHLTCGFCITSLSTVYSATCTVCYLYCNVLCDIEKGKQKQKKSESVTIPRVRVSMDKARQEHLVGETLHQLLIYLQQEGELTAEARRGLGCFDENPSTQFDIRGNITSH